MSVTNYSGDKVKVVVRVGLKGDKGERGFQGDPGTTGSRGEKGDTGEQGVQGIQGPQGLQGVKGDKGDAGEKGDTGEKGERGLTGAQGPQGATGATGAKGDQGIKGDTGEKGDKGDTGNTGEQGPQGAKGDKGDKGTDGTNGLKGDKGEKGDTGSTGLTGPQGPQGAKGDPGTNGTNGLKGDKGEKGDKGDTGPSGVQGAKGDKGDAGLDGATGPQGQQGPQGVKGDKGDKGDAGANGLKGDKGEKGDTGSQGATGVQGPKGDKGDIGLTGNTGATGAKGEKGDTGAKGDKGDQGVQGIPGVKGDRGDQGIPGEVSQEFIELGQQVEADRELVESLKTDTQTLKTDTAALAAQVQGNVTDVTNIKTEVQELRDTTLASVANRVKSGTIAQLRSNTETINTYYVTEPTKFGAFYYDASDTTSADDGAVVIVSGTKRYKKLFYAEISPEEFGAAGDGVTNDRDSLQKACDHAASIRSVLRFVTVRVNKRYLISGSAGLNVRTNMNGGGQIYTQAGAAVNLGADNVSIRDVRIDGNLGVSTGQPSGRGLTTQGANQLFVQNVKITNVVGAGIRFEKTDSSSIENVVTNRTVAAPDGTNFGDGVYISGATNCTVRGSKAYNFQRIGFTAERSGSSTGLVRSRSVIFSDCIAKDFILSTDTNINGGFWAERADGVKFDNCIAENTGARGFVINRNNVGISDNSKYQYSISNSQVFNATVGITCIASAGQTIDISGGTITDCERSIDASQFTECNINDVTFARRDKPIEDFRAIINYVPNTTAELKSVLNVNGCINAINTTASTPITIPDVFDNNGDMTISNCVGNWSFVFKIRKFQGNIKVIRTLLDLSFISAADKICFCQKAEYLDCDIKLPTTTALGVCGDNVTFKNCDIDAISSTRMLLGEVGAVNLRIIGCKFNNTSFYDLKRANTRIYLKDSDFENYSSAQGLFELVTASVDRLEVRNCNFSETITAAPLQLSAGVVKATIGHNTYYSNSLTAGFIPNMSSLSHTQSTTAQRPAFSQPGLWHLDTTLNRMGYWNGSQLVMAPIFVTNDATSAPNKTALNSSYGNYPPGSVITYPSAGTGFEFRKLTELATSDWVETAWATGNKRIVP